MTLYSNSFDGGTSGTALSAANSGGASGNAFTAVVVSGGAMTFDSAQAAHGGMSVKVVPGSAGTNQFYYNVTGSNEVAWRGYFYFTAAPATSMVIGGLYSANGGTRTVSLQFLSTGKMRLQDATGSTGIYNSTASVPLNQWVRVGLHVKVGTSTTNGTIDFAMYAADSTTPLDSYSSAAINTGTVSLTTGRWGAYQTSTDATPFWVDDVAFDDAATALLGPFTVPAAASVRPNAVTANPGAWTNQGGAATLQAALADESDVTFLQTVDNPAAASITFALPPLAAGDVTVKVRHQASAASPTTSRVYELLQGAKVIASNTVNPMPVVWTDYAFTTTPAQTDAITDRTALALRVTDTSA